MGLLSPIQWCDGTVNPTMGCDGCELWQSLTKKNARRSCYAGLDHEKKGGRNPGFAPTFDHVMRFAGRMEKAAEAPDLRGLKRRDKPWLDGLPRLWFVSDMGDSLSKVVSLEYLYVQIIEVVRSAAGQRHMWLWLTKQPRRMAEFSAYVGSRQWPANLAVGTSITEPRYVDRIDDLLAVGDGTTTRFLSVEPQHQKIELAGALDGISWVIHGGESGPVKQGKLSLAQYNQREARPFDIAWARDVRDTCAGSNVRYFLKQLGSAPVEDGTPMKQIKDGHGGDWSEWPKDLRVREMPRPAVARSRAR
jgi:protein gp37